MTFRPFALTAAAALAIAPVCPAQDDPLPPGAVPLPKPPPKAVPVAEPDAVAGPRPVGNLFEVNGIAAKVNGRVITKNELAFMLAPIAGQLAAQFPRRGPEFEKRLLEARAHTLQELIDRELILHEFKHELGGKLRPKAIDDEIARQVRELYNGSEDAFRQELKKARMTMDGYRRMTEEKLIVQGMRSQQFADAPPPLPAEVEREYAEVKTQLRDTSKDKITFRKIFIPRLVNDPAATPESQLALAEDLARQIAAGGDFAELAKTHSADAFAAEGGQWPETDRVDLSPEFAAILFDAPENSLIGPLEDTHGFTIAIVTGRQLGPPPPLATVRDEIEERVRRKKTAERYDRWIARLRNRAMIDRKI